MLITKNLFYRIKPLMILLILFCGGAIGTLFAQEAKLQAIASAIEGKVEFRDPGAGWKPLKVGTRLDKGTMISTGFKSTATIKIGQDTIFVKPVTRLSLEDLVRTEGGTRTKLFLTVGRVKAEVNPEKREQVDFSIKSATATASVRGTLFETDGINLMVTHGIVQLENSWGQYRHVGQGEYSKVDNDNSVTIPVAVNPANGLEQLQDITEQVEADAGVTSPIGENLAPVVGSGTLVINLE